MGNYIGYFNGKIANKFNYSQMFVLIKTDLYTYCNRSLHHFNIDPNKK